MRSVATIFLPLLLFCFTALAFMGCDYGVDDDEDDDSGDLNGAFVPFDDVEVYQEGDDLVIKNSFVMLRYHLTPGRYSIFDAEGNAIITNAEAAVWSRVVIPQNRWHSSELPLVQWTTEEVNNALGRGKNITVTRGGGDAPLLHQTFALLRRQSPVLADVRVENGTGDAIKIGAIYPLFANAPAGALHFGSEYDIRILTNGTLNYLEFIAPILPGTMSALSNWNMLVYNQRTKKSLAMGFLSFETAQPVFYYGPGGGNQTLHADCQYEPAKAIPHGGFLEAETLVLDFASATPFDALETYADRVKAWLNIQTWPERHPEIGVPVGWNSWSGGSSSGGYGTDITEEIILENMEFADRELRRWGMNYFQIDDGWQIEVGDWEVNKARFPDHGSQNGIEWLMEQAKQKGFQTGLWIAAFNAAHSSQIVSEHPEYFADPMLEGLIDWDERYLDLTSPLAQAHLEGIMETLLDWGVQWVKLDFAYWAPFTTNWYDPNVTRGEFYRTGVRIMRETLGEDVFFLNVAVVGWNIGLVDSVRLTLDTMPSWEGENPSDPINNQGLKPMYRDAARRYYLNNRLFINHPDLIFFRAHAEPQHEPLTLNESQTFATAVALQGGLVKIGDRIVDLKPEWVDTLRKIMPVQLVFSRPLDLFEREFPEVWSVPIEDFDEPYHVIGLLNWGLNKDLTTIPPSEIPDADRTISVDLERAGLDADLTYHAFEFWTQRYLGKVTDKLSVEVPARTPRVVALRKALDRPQLVGTNRHVLGGAGVIYSVEWNGSNRTLSGTMEGSIGTEFAPFKHRLTFYLPSGFVLDKSEVNAPDGFEIADQSVSRDGHILTLAFSVVETSKTRAQQHPEISWKLTF